MELSAAESTLIAALRADPGLLASLRTVVAAMDTPEPAPVVEPEPVIEPEPEPEPPPFVPPEPYERLGRNTIGLPVKHRYTWAGGEDGKFVAERVPHFTPHERLVVERPHELTGRPIKYRHIYDPVSGTTESRCISPAWETDPDCCRAMLDQYAEAMLLAPGSKFSTISQAKTALAQRSDAQLFISIVKAFGLERYLSPEFR